MKRLYILVMLLTAFQVNSIRASHVAGAELTYQCLGNGNYEITFTFYRDCFGIPPPTTVQVAINNSCGFPDTTATLTMQNPPVLLNPGCGQYTTCNGGSMIGIQECIYTGIITLPAQCSNWTLGVSMSARNAGIGGVHNPDFYNLYVMAGLNNMNNLCNNSPVFENDPIVAVCINQPLCLNPGGHDIDGDSLVYSFMTPLSDANNNIIYNPPFSFNQPLISNPPTTINSTNGEICFTPTQPFVTCYAILVQEYRNGVIIGQVERDIILYSMPCNSQPPVLSGVNGTNIYDISVCAYYPACFYIYSNDPNASDSTTISWDHSISSASINTSSGQHELGFFCWIPGQSDINTVPHCFNVYVRDNNCPAFQTSSMTYCITVHDTTAICSPVSVDGVVSDKNKLLIYPQPASDRLYIDYGEELIGQNKLTLTISNILNKVVYRTMLNEQITSIDINDFISSGVFQACLIDQRGAVIKYSKFVVIK